VRRNLFGLAATVVLLGTGACSSAPVDAESAAIRAASLGAIETTLHLDTVLPATYRGGPMPPAMLADLEQRLNDDLATYFTPDARAKYGPGLSAALNPANEQWDWDTDAGFGEPDWRSEARAGESATVVVRLSEWVSRHGADPGLGTPRPYRIDSIWEWTVSLTKTSGTWRVSTFSITCLSGCP